MIQKARYYLSLLKRDFLFLFAVAQRYMGFVVQEENNVVLFGHPIISLSYVGRAVSAAGYNALVIVPEVYGINRNEDFDLVAPSPALFYRKAISSSVWVFYFDSFDCFFGFLRYFPSIVKRLVKTKFVVMPYGADSMEYQKVSDLVLRHALMMSYPNTVKKEKQALNRVERFTKSSDIVVGCMSHNFNLPKWDVLPVHYYPIDIEKVDRLKEGVLKNEQFTVVHSPNHRGVKGTHLIMQAVSELQQEGVDVALSLLERTTNDEVIKKLHASHLLIDQVIGGGYALSAMEGMACGIPVVAHIRHEVSEVFEIYSYFRKCPIVSCERTVKSIKGSIKFSMENYETLSVQSRQYVEEFHSTEALSLLWGRICDSKNTDDLMGFYLEE